MSNCQPPLEEYEVTTIIDSACKYEPGIALSLTDVGDAIRLAILVRGEFVFCRESNKFMFYEKNVWVPDDGNVEILRKAREVQKAVLLEAAETEDAGHRDSLLNHAKTLGSKRKLDAIVALVKSEPGIAISASIFDRNPLVLAVMNGVVELDTGNNRPGKPEDFLTRQAGVHFDCTATCPSWDKFMNDILEPDVVEYLQRVVGYMLSGLTNEHCLFFIYGIGANGKSTFQNIVFNLLGSYSKIVQTELLMTHQQDRGPKDYLAGLKGSRLVVAAEVEEGRSFAESQIKSITGGDPIACRFLYGEYFEYTPEFKLLITGNYKPTIRGADEGIWRRIRLIHFGKSIPKEQRDKNLPHRLERELPGILNWALTGFRKWKDGGLDEPVSVVAAVEEYRGDMDIVQQWVDECCEKSPGSQTTNIQIYDSFKLWADRDGHWCPHKRQVLHRLELLGFARFRAAQARGFEGLSIHRLTVTEYDAIASK